MKKQLIEFYLDWIKNYPTIKKMSEDYRMTKKECRKLIDMGRDYLTEEMYNERKQPSEKQLNQ